MKNVGKFVIMTRKEYGEMIKEKNILKIRNKKLQNEISNMKISEQLKDMGWGEIEC